MNYIYWAPDSDKFFDPQPRRFASRMTWLFKKVNFCDENKEEIIFSPHSKLQVSEMRSYSHDVWTK